MIEADVLNAKLSTLPLQSGSADEEGISCLEIEQLTPLRVLHRRSLLKRKRYIYSMSAVPLNSNYFLLQVVTSAGTYVKEVCWLFAIHTGKITTCIHSLCTEILDVVSQVLHRSWDVERISLSWT